jgi:type IV pilus assembly protein PilC
MKSSRLPNGYLSAFCLELSLLLNAGVTLGDGLYLMLEDEADKKSQGTLRALVEIVSGNRPLSVALAELAVFPDYMIHMVSLGEKTGRLSQTLQSLSEYYDAQERLHLSIKNALLYPGILLVMMIAVIVIMLTFVLPIFEDVFHQLGTELPAFTAAMRMAGVALANASLAFAIIGGLLLVFVVILLLMPKLRTKLARYYRNFRGDHGLPAKIALARFTNALAMTVKSGLPVSEGFKLAAALSANSVWLEKKYRLCTVYLNEGSTLSDALSAAAIFPASYSRMMSLGVKSGSADTVLGEIARRSEKSVNETLEALLGRIEPALVIITSLIVGVILLSVMLPLLNIMAALG